jgi:hypothetical protein
MLSGGGMEDSTYIPLGVGFSDSAYQVRLFVRGRHPWYPILSIQYAYGPGPALAYATLSPTGRMTSDGWLELESAPISIEASRSPYLALMLMSYEIEVDAIEVVPATAKYKPNTACLGDFCGVDQVCVEGYCQDGNPLVPALPSAAQRGHVVDVLQNKIRIAFGGVATRQEPMQQALATMETMRTAQSPWEFWNTFAHAIRTLHDSHTMSVGLPSYSGTSGKAFPICFVEGDADSSKSIVASTPPYADVLISHVGPYQNLGLKPGDRLVSVDGQHPIAWLKNHSLGSWISYHATDPEVFSGEVESLQTSIRALASRVQVIRCNPSGTCSQPETIIIADLDDGMMLEHPTCDHRPAYHLASNNPNPDSHSFDDVRYGLLKDSAPGEDLYGMLWNDTNWDYSSPNPWKSAYSTFRSQAKGLILDHRRGDGGTAPGAAYLTELSRPVSVVSVWSTIGTLGLFDQPFTQSDGLELFNLWKNDPSKAYEVGSYSPREDMRIAVLLARDVSGSDFFPFGVKGSKNTKLFGRRTMGAFSTFFSLEAQGFFYWTLASGDFIGADGKANIGHGVEPDVMLLPKQSDLLVGKDTVYERALAWVRCGQEVCP